MYDFMFIDLFLIFFEVIGRRRTEESKGFKKKSRSVLLKLYWNTSNGVTLQIEVDSFIAALKTTHFMFYVNSVIKFELSYYFLIVCIFLAHLWGAYAITVALSGVCRRSAVVRRVLSVSTITIRNN